MKYHTLKLQQYDKKSNLKKACTAQHTLKVQKRKKTKIYSIHFHGEQCLHDFQCPYSQWLKHELPVAAVAPIYRQNKLAYQVYKKYL